MIKLERGDCLKLMKSIPDKSVDMVLADLPYGKTKAKWDVPIALKPLWKQYKRVITDPGCIALFGQEPFASTLRLSNPSMYRYDWTWRKSPRLPFMAHKRPLSATEDILIFYKHLPTYNPQMRIGKPWIKGVTKQVGRTRKRDNAEKLFGRYGNKKLIHHSGVLYPINLVTFNDSTNQYHKSYHPTQKPTDLLRYLLRTYTNQDDLVLDNCMGGGSTGVACKQLGRNFIGIEKDNYYFKVAKDRINRV